MVFTCCCKCVKACQVLVGLAAGLHRGQAPVKGPHSQCTLVDASSRVETDKKTAQMMFWTHFWPVVLEVSMQDVQFPADATSCT